MTSRPDGGETSDRPCEDCGKLHQQRELPPRPPLYKGQKPPVTWADPDDGHAYRPVMWAKFAASLKEELARLRSENERLREGIRRLDGLLRGWGHPVASAVAAEARHLLEEGRE